MRSLRKLVEGNLGKIINPTLNNSYTLNKIKNDYVVKKTVRIFKNKDFLVNKIDTNRFKIVFNNKLGFEKPDYSPEFHYDWPNRIWHVSIGSISLFSLNNPCFELINELRGYTILDNIGLNDVIIDAGCSDGFISCYFAKKVGENGKVICLEPDSRASKWILENIRYNHIRNVLVINKALHRERAKAFLELRGVGGSKVSVDGRRSKMEIETTDIFSLLAELKIRREKIRFVKLDIEGAELDVLEDLIALVEGSRETIVGIA